MRVRGYRFTQEKRFFYDFKIKPLNIINLFLKNSKTFYFVFEYIKLIIKQLLVRSFNFQKAFHRNKMVDSG